LTTPAPPHRGSWRYELSTAALTFVGVAAFPRLARRLRWRSRLGPRGLLISVAFDAALLGAIRMWAIPFFERVREDGNRARAQLRAELGREPGPEEVTERLLARYEG
jgi:hypothetical protein